jgi:hypothetical protein
MLCRVISAVLSESISPVLPESITYMLYRIISPVLSDSISPGLPESILCYA